MKPPRGPGRLASSGVRLFVSPIDRAAPTLMRRRASGGSREGDWEARARLPAHDRGESPASLAPKVAAVKRPNNPRLWCGKNNPPMVPAWG